MKCCALGLPAEIKVQTSKNYETCKGRCKLCHINQTDQTTTWKENCIEFIKQAECRLRPKIHEIYLFRKNSFFTGKKPLVETISVTIPDSSDVRCLDLQLKNIFTKRQEDAQTLRSSSHLIICYRWRSKFTITIDIIHIDTTQQHHLCIYGLSMNYVTRSPKYSKN